MSIVVYNENLVMPDAEIEDFQKRYDTLKKNNQWEELVEYLQPLAERYVRDFFINTELSVALYRVGRYSDSLYYAEKAYHIEKRSSNVVFNYACALLDNEKYSEAIEVYNRLLSKKIETVAYGIYGCGLKDAQTYFIDALYYKALCYAGLGRHKEARRLFELHLSKRRRGIWSDVSRKAVMENFEWMPPVASKCFQNKLDELKENGDDRKLVAFLQPLTELYPKEYFIFEELSQAYRDIDKRKALLYAEKAYSLERNDVIVLYALGFSLWLNERFQEADSFFDKILAKRLKSVAYGIHGEGLRWAKSKINDALYLKGCCQIKLGNRKDAIRLICRHLDRRRPGIYSDFSLREVRVTLGWLYKTNWLQKRNKG